MRPFNLKEALAGKSVVTRDGRPVSQITRFVARQSFPVVGVIDGDSIETYTLDGKFFNPTNVEHDSGFDLFMNTEIKTGFINVYASGGLGSLREGKSIYSSKSIAETHISEKQQLVAAGVPITWEE